MKRTGTICSTATVLGLLLMMPSVAVAQETDPKLPAVTTQVDVVLTRFKGDTKVSSLPFTLMVNAESRMGRTSIRMGVDVPVGTSTSNLTQTTGAQGNSPRAVGTTKVETEFRNVGTDIDAGVQRLDDGAFSVFVNVRDSSLFSDESSKALANMGDAAAFRTFSTSNTLKMLDGQTRLFGVATDKITGETLRIEVRLTVLK